MQERHIDRTKYFREQEHTTKVHVLPFIRSFLPDVDHLALLEVGCGEGGNLKPFLEAGCRVTGIDISPSKIENARKFFAGHPDESSLRLIAKDVYDAGSELGGPYDIIMMRDVIEHIPDQERFMGFIRQYLKPSGLFFLAFPPWQNPFGGHQQICESKLLSRLPYFHLLPAKAYRGILSAFGESEQKIRSLMEIRETGISIERFKTIVRKKRYIILKEVHYLINPNYEVKFGLRPRKQNRVISSVPFLRNVLSTAAYFLLEISD